MKETILDILEVLKLYNQTPYMLAAQIMGYIGLLCAIIGFQCKRHKPIMLWRIGNEFFFGVQFFMMHTWTGLMMNVIGTVRNIIFTSQVEKNRSTRPAQIVFSVLFVVLGMLTYNGYISILVIAAKVITTFAYGMKNTSLLRLLTLPTCICWMIYNIYCGIVPGVICEIFTITSILTAMIRIDVIPWIKRRIAHD